MRQKKRTLRHVSCCKTGSNWAATYDVAVKLVHYANSIGVAGEAHKSAAQELASDAIHRKVDVSKRHRVKFKTSVSFFLRGTGERSTHVANGDAAGITR